jgi:hypothetical protein
MREKQPPSTNLPSIEDTNQSRTVSMPTKSQVDPSPNDQNPPSQLGQRSGGE